MCIRRPQFESKAGVKKVPEEEPKELKTCKRRWGFFSEDLLFSSPYIFQLYSYNLNMYIYTPRQLTMNLYKKSIIFVCEYITHSVPPLALMMLITPSVVHLCSLPFTLWRHQPIIHTFSILFLLSAIWDWMKSPLTIFTMSLSNINLERTNDTYDIIIWRFISCIYVQ